MGWPHNKRDRITHFKILSAIGFCLPQGRSNTHCFSYSITFLGHSRAPHIQKRPYAVWDGSKHSPAKTKMDRSNKHVICRTKIGHVVGPITNGMILVRKNRYSQNPMVDHHVPFQIPRWNLSLVFMCGSRPRFLKLWKTRSFVVEVVSSALTCILICF